MKQKDIVWVRLPFSDMERQKARPALVVSRDAYNKAQEDVIVCALTSNLTPGPYKVAVRKEDLEQGKLPLLSMVRADKLLQVEKALIGRSLARLKDGAYDRVLKRIHELVGRRPRPSR